MLKNSNICTLDIGSSKIAACVARVHSGSISSLVFEDVPARGIKKGVVTDSLDLIGCIGKVLKTIKEKSGVNIKFLHVNISGQDIVTKHSRAIIPLAERGNKVIALSDINRVNEQARILGSSLEEEIIHQIPFGYSIDSKSDIPNPIGLYSHKLEVDLFLICGKLSCLQSLGRVINQAGYEIKKIHFTGLATSRAVFSQGFGDGLNVFCDIGSDITELLIFQGGVLKDIKILPLGGDDLTQKLAEALKLPFELAEDVKRSYGLIGDPAQVREDKEILIRKNNIYRPIRQRDICEILNNQARDISQRIRDTLEPGIRCEHINNFVVAGRTVLTEGFIEKLEGVLGISVKLGRVGDPHVFSLLNKANAISGSRYLTYLTCLGMIYEAMQQSAIPFSLNVSAKQARLPGFISRIKEVYQEYF